jgi:long-chain acyl-CoA synthetase
MRYLIRISRVLDQHQDRPFLLDSVQDRLFTFRGFHEHAWGAAERLRQEGVRRGDRVVLLLPNCSELAVLYFACVYLGAVAVPVNSVLNRADVSFIVEHSGAQLVLCAGSMRAKVDERLLSRCGARLACVRVGHDSEGETVGELDLQPQAGRRALGDGWEPLMGVSSEDLISITYTSGSTGRPKGVAHRIRDMIGNAERFCRAMEIGEEHRFYSVLPMTYMAGFFNLLLLPFFAGASVVITRGFDERAIGQFWRTAIRWECNTLWLVPSLLAILLKLDRGTDGERFCRSSVRLALVGTAPLPERVRQEFEHRYGLTLHESYGLSETLLVSTSAPARPAPVGSVGRVLPGVEVTLADERGEPVSAGAEGELLVRSPDLMAGYVQFVKDANSHSPRVGPEMDSEGWFATGDIGRFDGDGMLWITGRRKDLIIRGGINVSPRAIEEVLEEHEAVAEAAVVGIPHDVYGEDIAAVVRLKAGFNLSEVQGTLRAFCRERLNPTQQPGLFLEIDEFPLSPTGKVQKGKLRDLIFDKLRLPRSIKAIVQSHTFEAEESRTAIVVRRSIQRPPPDLLVKLQAMRISTLVSCVPHVRVLDSRLVPLVPGRSMCGPCVTVEDREGGDLIALAAVEVIQPGDVLLLKGREDGERASWSLIQTRAARLCGAGGIVVLGLVSDVGEVVRQGLPVFAFGVSALPCAEGSGGTVNLPVLWGGEPVSPGDIVIGNEDGVVVVQAAAARDVLAQAQRLAEAEQRSLFQLESGAWPLDATGLRSRFRKLGGHAE